MAKTIIFRTFTENFPKVFRKLLFTKSVQNHFLFSVDFQIFRRSSENSPRIFRRIIVHKFCTKASCQVLFPKFSKNFERNLVNRHFQFWLAAESIGQDGAILPDDKPMKFQESRAGWVAIWYWLKFLLVASNILLGFVWILQQKFNRSGKIKFFQTSAGRLELWLQRTSFSSLNKTSNLEFTCKNLATLWVSNQLACSLGVL